jgi:hypothetical protein
MSQATLNEQVAPQPFIPTAGNGTNTAIPKEILEAIAISNASSIGEQPAILANIALANQIFNINLLQQNAILSQQLTFQFLQAVLAKYVDTIIAIDLTNPQAIQLTQILIREFFDLINSKMTESLKNHQQLFNQSLEASKNSLP